MTPAERFKRFVLRRMERIYYREPAGFADLDHALVRSILIIRQHDQLGDFLLSTPVFRAVRNRFPDARIGLVTRGYFAEIAASIRFIDEVITVPGPAARWNPFRLRKFWQDIRSGWTLAIVLNTVSHSLTSDLISYYSRAPFVLGPSDGVFPGCKTNFFYNLIAPAGLRPCHQSAVNMEIIRPLGVDGSNLEEVMTVPEKDQREVEALFGKNGLNGKKVVGMHIGAGKPPNRWDPVSFAGLCDRVREECGAEVAVFSGPAEADLMHEFLRAVRRKPVIIGPTTLLRLSACFRICSLVVCNDTGVLHLAAATGVPVLGLFGQTNPLEWMPVGQQHAYLRGESGSVNTLSVDRVFGKVREMLR